MCGGRGGEKEGDKGGSRIRGQTGGWVGVLDGVGWGGSGCGGMGVGWEGRGGRGHFQTTSASHLEVTVHSHNEGLVRHGNTQLAARLIRAQERRRAHSRVYREVCF